MPVDPPEPVQPTLRIWQQNLNKSLIAQQCLLQTSHTAADSHDIICIQEPYIDFKGNSRALRKWTACYPTPTPTIPELERKRIRSVIFVRADINTTLWSQVAVDSLDVTAIVAHTPQSSYLIINVYNDCHHSDSLDTVRSLLQSRQQTRSPDQHEEVILLGDFNRHHPLWDEPRNHHLFTAANLDAAQTLLNLTADFSLQMALPPYLPTLLSMASKNYTRPDNVFMSEGALAVLTDCTTHPAHQPASSDHIPVETILDIPLSFLPPIQKPDFRKTDWEKFRATLATRLQLITSATSIASKEAFDAHLTSLYEAIEHAIDEHVPLVQLSPFAKRWWSKELEKLRKKKMSLGRKAAARKHLPGDRIHGQFRKARNKYSNAIKKAKKEHWEHYLEELSVDNMWTAHRIVSAAPSDGSHTRIPPLDTSHPDGTITTAVNNDEKAHVLLRTFFPPPTQRSLDFEGTGADYPDPEFQYSPITEEQVSRAIARLLPFKASHSNNVSNAILKQCSDLLIPHLTPLFRASIAIPHYPSHWRNSSIIVLRKPGKPNYKVAKAYRPIELLCSIGKLLSSVVAEDIVRATEQLQILPSHQFGSRPGRSTADALHYIVTRIKNEWRRKNVVSALFLDVKGAFPSVVVKRLTHIMRMKGIPKVYTDWIEEKGKPRVSTLAFDGFISPPLPISVGLPQGCPLSPLCFILYNAALNDVPNRKLNEDGIIYVDDTTYIAAAKDFRKAHQKLKRMMTKRSGAIAWALDHNSEFEISKSALVGFTHRQERDPENPGKLRLIPCPPLIIDGHAVPVKSDHKFLGVILDRTLSFKQQEATAIAKGSNFINAFRRLAKPSMGVPPKIFRHFYISIAIPRILYAASVWLTPPNDINRKSKGCMRRLASIQRQAAILTTGAMRSSPGDSLDTHADLLPFHLLTTKVCYRETIRMSCFPPTHPLHPLISRAAKHLVQKHLAPLHILLHTFSIQPSRMESILPVRFRANWKPKLLTLIPADKESALRAARNIQEDVVVFSDGSCIEDGVGAAAELYHRGELRSYATFYLGPSKEHTVFESELVGILMGLGMILELEPGQTRIVIGIDSQAAIRATLLHSPSSGSYLVDLIHQRIEQIKDRHPRITLLLQWVPGHLGIDQNESTDTRAKAAARGQTSTITFLLPLLTCRPGQLPCSKSAGIAEYGRRLKETAAHELSLSPRYHRMHEIDRSIPSGRYRKLIARLPRRHAAILYQLRSGHVPLNKHLFRIGKVESPACHKCGHAQESVIHFLLQCPAYDEPRNMLTQKLGYHARSLTQLLSTERALPHLFRFLTATGRFTATFGALDLPNQSPAQPRR